jgi:hypothetical protein
MQPFDDLETAAHRQRDVRRSPFAWRAALIVFAVGVLLIYLFLT